MNPLQVFIGYDHQETVAYYVAAHSIITRAERPVTLRPLVQRQLRAAGLYTRERGATESTEFSLTRFLCPALCEFKGWSLFVDADVLVLADISDLLLYAMAYPDAAVYVVKHDYQPQEGTKFLGQQQTVYPKKNWSSVMLFNNAKCEALTPDYVNRASGLDLHRFNWLPSESLIGELPKEWNHLVGEYPPNPDAKILHWTRGGPWFPEFKDCDHADLWRAEFFAMLKPAQAVESAVTVGVLAR